MVVKRSWVLVVVALLAGVVPTLVGAPVASAAIPLQVTQVTDGDASSHGHRSSSDGRYVVFDSSATDLIPGQTGQGTQIYLWDRTTSAITAVSSGEGTYPNALISSDGRYVAFASENTELVPGVEFTEGVANTFLWDRVTGVTRAVTNGSTDSFTAAMTTDGAHVAFLTRVDQTPGITGFDVVTWSRATGVATVIRPDAFSVGGVTISDDGRYVAYGDNGRVWSWDRTTNASTAISKAGGGVEPFDLSASSDGRYLTFFSDTTELVPGQGGGFQSYNVYLIDRTNGALTSVTTSGSATQHARNEEPDISEDGRHIVFASNATNLVPGVGENGNSNVYSYDRTTGAMVALTDGTEENSYGSSGQAQISANGRYVTYIDGNGGGNDAMLWDRTNGSTKHIMATQTFTAARPRITPDGRYVTFGATSDGPEYRFDVYQYDRDKLSVPREPTIGTVTAGDEQATVSWTAPISDGNSPITGYVVTPYTGGVAEAPRTFNSTATTQVVTGLQNFDFYTFTVAAKNALGTGAPSQFSEQVQPVNVDTAPSAPTIGTATAGNTSAEVTWSAPTDDGGQPLIGYDVTPYIGSTPQESHYFAEWDLSGEIEGLTNGTTYTFRVTASNHVGTSPMSAASNAVTPGAGAVPGAPTNVGAVARNGEATVMWSEPSSSGGSPITSYRVTPYIGSVAQPVVISNGFGLAKVVTGLTNGTTYTFKVAAVNAGGTGAMSAASNPVTPNGGTAPYAPFSSWSALVSRQYVDLTTKAPSSASTSSWVGQLVDGLKSKGDLGHVLRRGDENLANVDPVVRVYRAFLGRAPDAGGLQFWIRRKRNVAPAKTYSVTQIATEFTKSNEFKTKYGHLTDRQWTTAIYTDVLGRTADAAGVDYWTRQLDRTDTKRKTKAQVMVGFSESSEYKGKQAENTDVAVAYIYLLGRAPTTAQAADWVSRQKAGTTHATLLTELLNSAAYATRITG